MYPFELSGGMARRVLLLTALLDNPQLIIADEPTPGLDLPLAIKAMEDFRNFADSGGGVLLITHDIELALKAADRVAVFKDGTVIEETSVASFTSADTLKHPFSKQLWHALPEHDFSLFEIGGAGEQ
jgi:ABC-type dipeptide/oligopeptide/nickel transport system ATPase component